MRHVLSELFNLLLEQKGILEQALELSREKRQVIISGEVARLEEIVRLELRELSKLCAAEKKRVALNKAISDELGLAGEDITISAIAQRAAPDEHDSIIWIQNALTALIGQLADINKENRELIKAHLDYTEAMLELMVGVEDPLNNFYGGDGRAAPDRKKTTAFFNGQA